MAALSANPSTQTTTIARYDHKTKTFVVQTNEVIYDSSLVGIDGNGDLVAWADTANYKFVGIVEKAAPTTGDDTASPAVRVAVRVDGPTLYGIDVASVTDRNSIGALVYCDSDNPADLTLTNTSNVQAIGWLSDWRSNTDMDVTLFTPGEYLLQQGVSEITNLTDNTGGAGGHDDTLADGSTIGAALTDSTTGSAGDALAAGVGVQQITLQVDLAEITAADVVTTYTPGYKFKLLAFDFIVNVPVTTGSKAATLNLEIGTTDVTGGEIALTSANSGTLGAEVAGAAITALNTGSNSDTISVEATSVTAFAEGTGTLVITIQNMDTADAVASIAAKVNELRTDNIVQNQNDSDLAQKINEII